MYSVVLASTSRAGDAGYLAIRDLTTVVDSIDVDYRLVGGLSITILAALFGATGVPVRETADADLGADFAVVGDRRLIDALTALGYERPESSNRFIRELGDGMRAVIDVLALSPNSRHRANREHGAIVVDEIPGLRYALAAPPIIATVRARLTTAETVACTIRLPGPLAALILKLLA